MSTVQQDVSYGEGRLDVYRPDAPNGAAIIDFHGGGFFRGDKGRDADLGEAFAAEGYLVVTPNYRLAPDHLFPAAVDDALAVVDHLVASDLDFDRSRLGAFGSSAGGNLAIELALRRRLPIASWSGIIEIDDWLAAHERLTPHKSESLPGNDASSASIDQSGNDEPFYKWFLLNYLGGEDDAARARARDASPLRRVGTASGPMHLVNSLHEFVPRTGVLRLQAELAEAGVPSTVQLLAGPRHAKGYLDDAWPGTREFFRAQLGA